MRMSRRAPRLAALVAAGALVLTACSSGSDDPDGSTSDGGTTGAAVVTANGTEPQNPLVPSNTNEVGGGKIVDLLFAGLVSYDADGAPHNEVAESIESDDNVTWTVTLEDGWTFTNGEPVDARSFVDAWNYGALLSNGHLSSYFFEPIVGYSQDEDSELTGLTVVDDLTFTVTLTSPLADWPLRMGYSAYFPLPQAAYDDMDAFGDAPIGNGQYMLGGDGWVHNVGVDLVPNPDYAGPRVPQNDGVSIRFYEQVDAAYNDLLADQLDVLDQIPDTAFATFEDELGGRAVNQPAALNSTFTIRENLPHFSGEEGRLRRAAISMAIDRDEITRTIFDGTRTPAVDFTSPAVDGWSDSVPGNEVLQFDADRAVELWAEADAIAPWEGVFTLAYNADGGHQVWVDALTNGLRNVLGIEAEGQPFATFAEARTEITAAARGEESTLTGASRSGWQADYPGLYNFLGPIYATGAGSNDGAYANPEFDALLAQASSAESLDEANALFEQAQAVLLQDLPAIPLWYQNAVGGYSTLVDDVRFGWNQVPLLYQVTKS